MNTLEVTRQMTGIHGNLELRLDREQLYLGGEPLYYCATELASQALIRLMRREPAIVHRSELEDLGMSTTRQIARTANRINDNSAKKLGFLPIEILLQEPRKGGTLTSIALHSHIDEVPDHQRLKELVAPAVSTKVEQLAIPPQKTSEWMPLGSCKEYGPSVMCPPDGKGVDRARKICAGCCVKDVCLEYALIEKIEHGVWGGTSERERRRILRRRARMS